MPKFVIIAKFHSSIVVEAANQDKAMEWANSEDGGHALADHVFEGKHYVWEVVYIEEFKEEVVKGVM